MEQEKSVVWMALVVVGAVFVIAGAVTMFIALPEQPSYYGAPAKPFEPALFGIGFGAFTWAILFFAAAAALDRLREIRDELARIRQQQQYPGSR